MTDSKSIFDNITKLSCVADKRLMMDISALLQSYSSGEITNIGYLLSEFNLADGLTKKTKSKILDKVLRTGKMDHEVNLWTIHENDSSIVLSFIKKREKEFRECDFNRT